MKAKRYQQLDNKRLRRWLVLFFLALYIPSAVLVYQAYDQLKWEAFHLHSNLAEELATRIDNSLLQLIKAEEQRPFTAYAFLNVAGDKTGSIIQRSPLSAFPIQSEVNGIIGYFQLDPREQFSTPLLPSDTTDLQRYGINDEEYAQRLSVQNKLYAILSQNKLIQTGRADKGAAKRKARPEAEQAQRQLSLEESVSEKDRARTKESADTRSLGAFDELASSQLASPSESMPGDAEPARKSLGKVGDLKLESKYEDTEKSLQLKKQQSPLRKSAPQTGKRTEQNVLPEQRLQAAPASAPAPQAVLGAASIASGLNDTVKIEIFESEVDPFEFAQLASGQFVLYRKVWRDKQRYIQGILINSEKFMTGVIEPAFRATSLSDMSNLAIAYNGEILSVIGSSRGDRYLTSADQLQGALLYRTRLSAPLDRVELIFSINNLPAGPGGKVIIWSSLVLGVVLLIGFILLYKLGVGQINLARQQQDFVSAISHELKTPLTSIRMYGEMLREGWADEAKKRTYYDYIFSESERLSRLINNILQLARMTRNDLHIELKPYSLAEISDTLRSKVTSQVERAGMELELDCDPNIREAQINVDMDYLIQIIINLTDNAIKFSAKAQRKRIEIHCRAQTNRRITISVRDYGPGIAKDQLRKIFKLFYRSENELTRETVGTGIGLALVNQLTQAMQGNIDVIRHEPGAEFVLSFPINI